MKPIREENGALIYNEAITVQCYSGRPTTGAGIPIKHYNGVMIVLGANKKCWYLGGQYRALVCWNNDRFARKNDTALYNAVSKCINGVKTPADAIERCKNDPQFKIVWTLR